jgi:hypothetical protein
MWKIFDLDEIFKGKYSQSLNDAKRLLENVYLNKERLGKMSVGVYDPNDVNAIRRIEFLPCEKKFWSETPIWTKGIRVPGYFLFETYMNATPMNKQIRPVIKLEYPISLRERFCN